MAAPKAILEGSPRDVASPARRHHVSDADIDALKAHPQFAEACRRAALSGIELYRGNRLVNTMLTDRGRSSLSLLALYLHFDRQPGDPRSLR